MWIVEWYVVPFQNSASNYFFPHWLPGNQSHNWKLFYRFGGATVEGFKRNLFTPVLRRVALKYRGRDDSFPWITMSNKPARRRLVNSIIKVSRAPVGTWCTRWSSAGWRTCSSWRRRQPRCSSTQWSWRQRTSRTTQSFERGNDMIRRTAVEKLNFSDRRGAKKKTARGTFLHNWHAIMRIPTNPLWR